jgi:serine/threonine protein kinase
MTERRRNDSLPGAFAGCGAPPDRGASNASQTVDVSGEVHLPRDGSATGADGDEPLQAGEVLDGKYRVGALLGAGSMGLVFEAHHLLLDKQVAIKVLRPELTAHDELRRRFEIEARAAAAVAHPNVVTVTDMGRTLEGAVYFVMDRLAGETLADKLAREGRLELSRAAHIAVEVLDGLEAAHSLGLVHRDLKLENVFLARGQGRERVKILDFGVAKVAALAGSAGGTQAGDVMGTPESMAPEQARGDPRVDARVDLYAVGVLLYKTLSGRAPFVGSNGLDVMARLLTEAPPSLSDLCPQLPPALVALVMSALSRDRDLRPATAADFRDRLEEACAGLLRRTGSQLDAFPATPSSMSSLVPLDQHPATGERPAFRAPPPPGEWSDAPTNVRRAPALPAPAPPASSSLSPSLELAVPDRTATPRPQPVPHTPAPVVVRPPRRSATMTAAVSSSQFRFRITERLRALLVVLGLAVIGLGMWRALHWESPVLRALDHLSRSVALEPTPASSNGEPPRVTVTIDVSPVGSALEIDGEPLKRQRLELLRSSRLHTLRAYKEGFESGSVEFVADDWKTIMIRLPPLHHRKTRPARAH